MGCRSTPPAAGEPLNIPTSIIAKISHEERPLTSFQSQPWNRTLTDTWTVTRSVETQRPCRRDILPLWGRHLCAVLVQPQSDCSLDLWPKSQKAKNTSENMLPDLHCTPATLSREQPQAWGHPRVSNGIHVTFEPLFQLSLPYKSHLPLRGWCWGLRKEEIGSFFCPA